MKKVAILGSTGSIGRQTLEVIKGNKDKFSVSALIAYSNKTLLKAQQIEFNANFVGLIDNFLNDNDGIACGEDVLLQSVVDADIIVVATRGIIALPAVLYALRLGKTVAIANKEIMVTAGHLVLQAKKEGNATLLPIDSEHNAIFQCLQNQHKPKKIILTCSGGAFLGKTKEELFSVTPMQALAHPKWNMGEKITIDSATLINKGLEVLEAYWFFGVDIEDIQVVVHQQSVIHSMVEFFDGSILAQLGVTDMRLPIAYALNYPNRVSNNLKKLDLISVANLTFSGVNNEVFKGIEICRNAFKAHKMMPAVLVSADEVAVEYFLKGKIKFLDIYQIIEKVCDYYKNQLNCIQFDVEAIFDLDKSVKDYTCRLIEKKYAIIY